MTGTVTTQGRGAISWGGWAGVAGVAIPAIGLAIRPIWTLPSTTAGGSSIDAYAAAHQGALQAMMLTYTIGVSLWLVFGAAVWARLRATLPAASVIPTCFAAGLIGFVTLLIAGFTAFDVLVYRQSDPGEAQLLYDMAFGLLAMSGMPTAIALTAYAIAVYRYEIMPRQTAHLAAAAAAAHVLLLLSFIARTGFFSLEGATIATIPALLWAWIADTGICMTRTAAHARH